MSSPNFPDFESMLSDALDVRLTQVIRKSIKYTPSRQYPNARVVTRTTVVSVIEKTGRFSNLAKGGTK